MCWWNLIDELLILLKVKIFSYVYTCSLKPQVIDINNVWFYRGQFVSKFEVAF